MNHKDIVNGRGKYINDIKFDGMLYMSLVRSPYAHAKINRINGGLNSSELKAYYMSEEMASSGELGSLGSSSSGASLFEPVLAIDYVNYMGQPVAAVFGNNEYESEDLLDSVEVDYDPLEAVATIDDAFKKGSIHNGTKNNIVNSSYLGRDFNPEYDVVVEDTLMNNRIVQNPIETRGIVAVPENDNITVYISTQSAHLIRDGICSALKIPKDRLRVIQADTGGAFGLKAVMYPEYIIAVYAAMKYKRPVKWIETRREHLMAAHAGRGIKAHLKLYAKKDGKITGIKGEIIVDAGAYKAGVGESTANFVAFQLTGPYDIKNAYINAISVFTNKAPMGYYRGAGRPEASFFMERMIDLLADKLNMDPARLRLINASDGPFRSPLGLEVKEATRPFLENALKAFNYYQVSKYEHTGISFFVLIPAVSPGETARALIKDNKIKVWLGGNDHGQGHEYLVKSILSDQLGIDPDIISYENGDTSSMESGIGTWGSRSAIAAGSALYALCRKLKDDVYKKYGDYSPELLLRDEHDEYVFAKIDSPINSVNACMVTADVDDLGNIKVKDIYSYFDLGHVMNRENVNNQIYGGSLQGMAQVLSECVRYSEDGQLMTSSIYDAGLLTADKIPRYHNIIVENPSNALNGAKGLGESPAIGVPSALSRAVEMATGKRIRETPVSQEYLIK
ncbi:xanthine dehydrogenase family protein molybdopterin-binding subunit [Picrophilus oshimae]|uniref:Carbon monoxide dehydrogenase beta subunit n=1 Tax=Picrophilus torridus (strain ATCC 700027 / DSM 9790 / JCM 10055 / NBRC 100828 / KAW 2/3) TaxID=1122961 RepID=Q6KZZ6_PICTO|nr:xanthine dehydrogenase family protein molybdopterin-binding subunit [Picrophilus oshimae]AAT43706.1 carbon monoxide dehydrogenase beta subunit [Picrophilus oshimae DSM 9789]